MTRKFFLTFKIKKNKTMLTTTYRLTLYCTVEVL